MSEPQVFYPHRKTGLVFHAVVLGLLLIGGGYTLWQAVNAEAGNTFIKYLAPAGLAVVVAGQVIFSVYGLWTASYTLDTDGMRFRWGLRAEDIPGNDILWVVPETESPFRLRFPFLRWPGSVVGSRKLPDGRKLEFMADRSQDLALVATTNVIYIVSPEKIQEFLNVSGFIAEQGVIAPLEAHSEATRDLLAVFWADLKARYLVIAGLALAITIPAVTALIASGRETVILHAGPIRVEPVVLPAVRLMLLPVLNGLFAAVDLVLGLLFYRSLHLRPLAYLIWTAAVVCAALFTAAVGYTLFFA